ncbi:MAG: hypothetical protein ACRYF4_02735 [Janthinobacterium lividum]
MGIDNLIAFWKSAVVPDQSGNYIHPADKGVLQGWLQAARPGKARSVTCLSVAKEGKEPPRTGQLHLRMPPMPYVGNLSSAKIILAMINPTINDLDYTDHERKAFRDLRQENLRQSEGKCFALDPAPFVDAASWSTYYRRMFKAFLDQYAKGTNRVTLEERLASEVAILELVPYYSQNATMLTQGVNLIESLKSAECALAAMRELSERKDTLIICRWESGLKRWGLADLESKATVVCSKSRSGLSEVAKKAVAAQLKLSS